MLISSFFFSSFDLFYFFLFVKMNSNDALQDRVEKLSLTYFIQQPFINAIYLIDIELVTIFFHCFFLFLYMKRQYYFIHFLSNIYWSVFNKCYYSFILTCNIVILFIFYQSESIIKFDLGNIYLYFFIDSFVIFIITIIIYITLELPLKKIFKYIIDRNLILPNSDNNAIEEETNN